MRPRIVIRSSNEQPSHREMRSRNSGRNPFHGIEHIILESSRRRPFFSNCWISTHFHPSWEVIEEYCCEGATVRIISDPVSLCPIYHLTPWEYTLPYGLVKLLREVIDWIFQNPPDSGINSLKLLREHTVSVAERKLIQLFHNTGISFSGDADDRVSTIKRLAEVVGRYTVGLGVFEILLQDTKIEDIFVDAPASDNAVHVTLNNISGMNSIVKCSTNIVAMDDEIEGLISRLRHHSKKPFSEAYPVMETDIPWFATRATAVGPPLSPKGVAVALRKRSRILWTLPRLISNGTLDPITAGMISFLVDGRSTILIAGARGAGKSTLLSALLFEFPHNQRILIIEDTQELPVGDLQSIGYDVQSLLVEPRAGESREIKTDEALRVSLRLGESAIILGEVRGKEAQTLYQSMRTGRAGSTVMGTIHGESATSVYERVVHDMGIPGEAFMATDVVLTMGLYRPRGAQKQVRKLIEIAECSKNGGIGEFNILASFLPEMDRILRKDTRSETFERIARSWNMSYEEVERNIEARGRIREILVKVAMERGPEFLEPFWVTRSNTFFWKYLEKNDGDYEGLIAEYISWISQRSGVAIG